MDGEKQPTHWTPENVKDLVLALIDANDKRYKDNFSGQDKAVNAALAAQEKAVNAALAASEKAVAVAETNAEKWRSNANEWRAAMTDREAKFVARSEYESLKERLDRMEGSSKGMRDLYGWVVAGIVSIIAVVGFVLKLGA